MATRAADDFDAIGKRLVELRREDALGRAAAVEVAKAAFPCPVPAAPKVQDPPAGHVVVGWEEPALLKMPDGRVVNPALEEVFARMRGYLDDTMGQRPTLPGRSPATKRLYDFLFSPPEPLAVRAVEDGPTFRGIPIRLPPPPDLGEPR